MIGMVYNMVMEYDNFRLYKKTVEKLRTIYGFTGVKMITIVDDLVTSELDKEMRERGLTKDEEEFNVIVPANTE